MEIKDSQVFKLEHSVEEADKLLKVRLHLVTTEGQRSVGEDAI